MFIKQLLTNAKTELKHSAPSIAITYSAEWEEYRVNYRNGREATAYYTTDIADAIGTAKAMHISARK
jgi:hypothetical protein